MKTQIRKAPEKLAAEMLASVEEKENIEKCRLLMEQPGGIRMAGLIYGMDLVERIAYGQ